MKKRVAIIGFGLLAQYIYPAIQKSKDFRCVAIVDKVKTKQEISRTVDVTGVPIYASYNEMEKHIEIDIIVLLTHHIRREKYLEELLENNLTIICEKPLCWTSKQKEMLKKYITNFPMVIYHRSYSSAINEFLNYINTRRVQQIDIYYLEEISKHTSFKSNYIASDADGGGCVVDNLPNCIHFLLKYGKLEFISASGNKNKTFDYTTDAIIVCLWNNITCKIHLDWHSLIDEKSIVLTTDDGIVKLDWQNGMGKDSLYKEYESFFCGNYTSSSKIDFTISDMIEKTLYEINKEK